jgi:hypothetical protein
MCQEMPCLRVGEFAPPKKDARIKTREFTMRNFIPLEKGRLSEILSHFPPR